MSATDDMLAESAEECDCLGCFRVALRSDNSFLAEPDVASYYEQQLRPRFIRLIRGVPGFAGDETFAEVLDKLADRLIPVDESVDQPMLLGSIPAIPTPGWPEGTVLLVNTRDLADLSDQPLTLLGDVPLNSGAMLPNGLVVFVRSREPGLMVSVTRDDWSTELLPAQTPCLLLEKT